MKKLYALALCSLLCASSVSAAPNRFAAKRNAKKAAQNALVAAPRETVKIWRPVSAAEFIYDEGEWFMLGEVLFTYDTKGNVLTQSVDEDGVTMVTTNTYNDDNMLTSRIDYECEEGDEPQYISKRTYVYDPIVKDYYIERMGYDWTGEDWEENYYCEINDITRNAAGSIVEIVKKVPYNGEMSPAYKSVWHYNETTGEADEYAYYANLNPASAEWELYDGVSYKNIEWQNTNGQMTKDFEELIEGPNRIKQAEVYFEDELDGYIFVTYSGENDYIIKSTFNDPSLVAMEVVRETLDENGSYSRSILLYLDDDDNITEEPYESEIETITYDAHGNVVEVRMEAIYGDDFPYIASEKYDYVYDEDGNPAEVTVSYYDEEEEDYIAISRTVYGEYIDVTGGTSGIENIAIGNNCKAVEVYNLNGVKVTDSLNGLAKGLYIVRNGLSVTKIAVK